MNNDVRRRRRRRRRSLYFHVASFRLFPKSKRKSRRYKISIFAFRNNNDIRTRLTTNLLYCTIHTNAVRRARAAAKGRGCRIPLFGFFFYSSIDFSSTMKKKTV